MLKKIIRQSIYFSWKQLINYNITFKLYNHIQESDKVPHKLRDLFIRFNRHAVSQAIGKSDCFLRLIGNNRKLVLPCLKTLSQWQFFQSYRWHDPFYSQLIRVFLSNQAPGTFLDVGANQGLRSLDALNLGWQVIAIEPNEKAINFLEEITKINNFIDQSKLTIQIACSGSQESTVELLIDKSSYLSTVIDVYDSSAFKPVSRKICPVITLNSVISSSKVNPAYTICKIDTEGYEIEVLKGLGENIKNIRILFIELATKNINEFISIVPHNSLCYWIDERNNKLVNIKDIIPSIQTDVLVINKILEQEINSITPFVNPDQLRRLRKLI